MADEADKDGPTDASKVTNETAKAKPDELPRGEDGKSPTEYTADDYDEVSRIIREELDMHEMTNSKYADPLAKCEKAKSDYVKIEEEPGQSPEIVKTMSKSKDVAEKTDKLEKTEKTEKMEKTETKETKTTMESSQVPRDEYRPKRIKKGDSKIALRTDRDREAPVTDRTSDQKKRPPSRVQARARLKTSSTPRQSDPSLSHIAVSPVKDGALTPPTKTERLRKSNEAIEAPVEVAKKLSKIVAKRTQSELERSSDEVLVAGPRHSSGPASQSPSAPPHSHLKPRRKKSELEKKKGPRVKKTTSKSGPSKLHRKSDTSGGKMTKEKETKMRKTFREAMGGLQKSTFDRMRTYAKKGLGAFGIGHLKAGDDSIIGQSTVVENFKNHEDFGLGQGRKPPSKLIVEGNHTNNGHVFVDGVPWWKINDPNEQIPQRVATDLLSFQINLVNVGRRPCREPLPVLEKDEYATTENLEIINEIYFSDDNIFGNTVRSVMKNHDDCKEGCRGLAQSMGKKIEPLAAVKALELKEPSYYTSYARFNFSSKKRKFIPCSGKNKKKTDSASGSGSGVVVARKSSSHTDKIKPLKK